MVLCQATAAVMIGSCEARERLSRSRAIVVHAEFTNMLTKPPIPARHWDRLPIEVLHSIASNLTSAKEVCLFERISKACRLAGRDERIWKDLCVKKFNVPPFAKPPSWKDMYRVNHEFLYGTVMEKRAQTMMDFRSGTLKFNIIRVMA